MGQEQIEVINAYLRKVESEWRTGQATEHTHRPMLKELLEHLLPKMMVINEPARIECGAPDYILKDSKTQLNICFIEAKDIGDADLDGKTVHKEQFSRYKDSLDSLCFTDYLDFRFYTHNDFIDSVRIAEIKGDRIVPAHDAELERFLQLIEHFADVKPQHITSPSRLAALMAGKAKLLAQGVRHYLKNEANADSVLAQQMEAFRNVLIHDIDVDSFADLFAQTITYGMFAARLHDPTPEDFSRAEAAQLIPKTNPLLRQMFQYIAMDADDSIEWIVDDLVALFAAVDVEKLMRGYGRDTQKSDPLLHFYEDFLAAYDPKLRKARGVWYTPKPIVDFIVRSVDHILEKDFGLPGGLADSSKVTVELKNDFKKTKFSRGKSIVHNEMHRVQILDPAAGTGTFLAEAVKRIHEKVVASMGEGAWQGYVGENLLPRLNGFEILMASYAMAHLKLDMLLAETGYSHTTNERLRVFLTNSLEPYDKETGTLFAAALSQEANEANFVKRDCPVMVVMGNPPYSGVSINNGDWAAHLIDDYKKEPGSDQPLQERKHWLNDDYVKFLSFAQHCIDKNGEGIVGFINNNGFIDNPTFRGMRWSLLKSFDDIYIFNLHGNSMKKEIAPNGGKDENVFDIMVGVSINIFVRRKKMRNDGSLAVVHYADFYGEREEKYAFLDQNAIGSVKWQMLDVQGPYFFFAPKDFGLQEEYEKGFRIDELMSVQSMSVLTARDDLVVDFTREELLRKIKYFADGARGDDEIRSRFWPGKKAGKYLPGDTRGWSLSDARKNVANLNHDEIITAIDYRPFDARFIYYSKLMVDWPRENVMRHLCRSGNLGLNVIRISTRDNHCALIATDKITDKTLLSSKDNANVFPLYLHDEKDGKAEKTPNFDAAIFEKIREAVNSGQDLQASANPVRNDDRLTFYRSHELGKTWYDVADPREFLSMKPIGILVDETADRKAVKSVFRQMNLVRNLVDGRCVSFPVAAAKKLRLLREVNVPGIAGELGRLFAMSRLAWSEKEAEIPNHKRHRNTYAYHHYIVKMSVEAGEYYVRFAVREDTSADARNELHDAIISNIVIYKAKGAELSDPGLSRVEDSTPFVDNKIALFLSAVNGVEKREEAVEPEDVFNYIYGVLHTPSYREKYREFLKIDFPRIPYPKSAAEFRWIAAVGEKLVKVHLLKDEAVTNPFANPYAKFEGTGDGTVEKVVFADEKVFINADQCFAPVPADTWNFYIGGYQPAQKWLKDRKGRKLSAEDVAHYKSIIAALLKTAALMKELEGGAQ